jgi:hypothetical protein
LENRVLRWCGAEMEEVTRGCIALHYKKIRDLYSLSNMYYCGDIKEDEMVDRVCGTHGRKEKRVHDLGCKT